MQDELPDALPDDKSIHDNEKRDTLEDDTAYGKQVTAEEKGPLQNNKTDTFSLPPDVNNDEHHEGTQLHESSSISSTTNVPNEKRNPLEDSTAYVEQVAAEQNGPLQDNKTDTSSLPPDVNNDEHHESTELAKSSSVSSTTKKKGKKVTTIKMNLYICEKLCRS